MRFRAGHRLKPFVASAPPALIEIASAPLPPDPGPGWRQVDPDLAPLVADEDATVTVVASAFQSLADSQASHAKAVSRIALEAIGQKEGERSTLIASAMAALRDLASRPAPAPVVHVAPAHVEVHTPDVRPEFHVDVPAPHVEVHVPAQPVPDVHVAVAQPEPAQVNVTVEASRPTRAVPVRDESGRIVAVDHVAA